jgi:hypothetical protein
MKKTLPSYKRMKSVRGARYALPDNMQKIIAGVLIFGWAGIALAGSAPGDQLSCEKLGGAWGRFGLMEIDQCNLPTTDANKGCNDSSDCEGVCFTDAAVPQGTKTNGQCYNKTITLGTCLNLVHDGIAQGQVCED